MRNHKKGFSIIELLIVMTIIMILAGLLMGASQKAKQQAMIAKTKAMISALETALSMFQSDIGRYPGSSSAAYLYNDLVSTAGGDLTTAEIASWGGPYMNFKQGEISGTSIWDAWNQTYHYTNPGGNHSGAGGPDYSTYFDLYSNGPNKADNGQTLDDICNWKR